MCSRDPSKGARRYDASALPFVPACAWPFSGFSEMDGSAGSAPALGSPFLAGARPRGGSLSGTPWRSPAAAGTGTERSESRSLPFAAYGGVQSV